MKFIRLTLFAAGMLVLASCSVTRRVPEGKFLLARNVIEQTDEKELPRSERVKREDLAKYIKQRPNKRLLGVNLYLGIYNTANPDKDNRWNNWKRRIGQEPAIYDSLMTVRSVDAMSIYLRGRGFFNSKVSYDTDTVRRKITVTYRVEQGAPYRLGMVAYDFRDRFLEPIVLEDSASTLLHPGEIFDVDVLQRERQRIASYVRDRGYYNFSINNISYVADSVSEARTVNLKMIVHQRVAGYDRDDAPVLENNAVYRIRDIYILTDYNPDAVLRDSDYYRRLDTVEYRGIRFLSRGKLNVRPDVLLRAVGMYPNQLYDAAAVQRAYNNVMQMNYFKNVSILFTELQDTTAENLVTFIGSEGEGGSDNRTRESYLSCNILCTPGPKQGYSIDLEATTTSNYYGLLLTMGYQNRNIFKGVELFEASLTGGYEFMRMKGKENSVEVGGALSLTFPRFIAPFPVDRYHRVNNVKTKLELSLNSQNRPYYRRVLSAAAFGYTWSNSRFSSYVLKPADISLVKLHSVDENFLDGIQNPYLRNSYTSQLIAGISGSYIYNDQRRDVNRNTLRVRVNAETNGNLLNLVTRLFSKRSSEGYYKVFDIQFAQYARVDADASYKFVLGEKTSLVYRLYAGIGHSYGNSSSIPFERLFYAGGPNSMRGWVARTLGPGNAPEPRDDAFPSQLGNVKLETNLEFRFPVYGFLQGALFMDVGNIWLAGKDVYTPEAEFRFNRFYRQLGFDGGLGARFDFGFFLFRVDWGVQLHNPGRPAGDRWIRNLTLRQTSFNFGIGYPF